ncbi:hypothetical protein [Bradyrhizobium sp. Ce-3]|uniref:hypothetical protein n=1 Tax=Bradyrhizobium sp. Ce-3 TaxID=2913970 RepID=UPI001FC7E5F7|nr:hypothetical protein [Bradyrhizobium sp. Ce-3]GKQ55121.1 hypothetical protein BRSPCE3_59760 [Bradyrhizobium sp. Ce-3]
MSPDVEEATTIESYETLLLRAGATGLNRQDIEDLAPGLRAIDMKIALLRRACRDDGGADGGG